MAMPPPTLEQPTDAGAPPPSEVLFKEARRRRRRRRGWILGLAIIVVAAGIGIALQVGTSVPRHRFHPPSSRLPKPARSATPTTTPPSALTGSARITYTTGLVFLNATNGYALFRRGSGRRAPLTSCGRLYVGKTRDGGARYGSLEALPGCDADAITFNEQGDGFVYGPSMYVTHDGGTRWAAQKLPGVVLSVKVITTSVWVLSGTCSKVESTAEGRCRLSLFESADAGRVWHRRPLPPTARVYRSGAGGAPRSLVMTSPTTGYVVPTATDLATEPAARRSGQVPVWSSSDGGRTWVKRDIPCGDLSNVKTPTGPPRPRGASVSAASTGMLFAICWYGYPLPQARTGQDGTVLTSRDGGVTWSTRGTDRFGGEGGGKLEAVSTTTAFELSFHGGLLKTADGGAAWQPTGAVGYVTSPFALDFLSPSLGVVLGNTTLWHTDDGGASWTEVKPQFIRRTH